MSWNGAYKNRPRKLSEAELNQIIGSLKSGANEAKAASVIGKSERWLRYQKEAYPELKELIAQASAVATGDVQSALYKVATAPLSDDHKDDPRFYRAAVPAGIFYLKNKAGWADKSQIATTIEVQQLPQIVDLSYRPEVLEAVVKMLDEQRQRAGLPPVNVAALEPATVDVEAEPVAAEAAK